MLKESFVFSALIACAAQGALADTVQLKDKASVTGKILAEKHDQIVLDIGYTVILVPRNQVLKIIKRKPTNDAVAVVAPIAPTVTASSSGGEISTVETKSVNYQT